MKGLIFDIKRDCSEDGPGIRTTVFFKGCPLSCAWCQNPEGKGNDPGLSFRRQSCAPDACGLPCVRVCESGALSLIDGKLSVAHAQCVRCDRCFALCETHALEPVGNFYTVNELLYRVMIDKPFYDSTGGGVTVSGGEATQQAEFVGEFLRQLKKQAVHTVLETSGFFNWRKFSSYLLPWLDGIFFDLKLMNSDEARHWTGQDNRLILDNLLRLHADGRVPLWIRVPLVPDVTARDCNLRAIAEFLRSHGIHDVNLMPYNPTWTDKPERIGVPLKYACKKFMSDAEIQAAVMAIAPRSGDLASKNRDGAAARMSR